MTARGKALNLSTSSVDHFPWRIHGAAIYGVPWIPSIYPLYVSIYTSTMDPSWDWRIFKFFEPRCAAVPLLFQLSPSHDEFFQDFRIQDQKWPCQTPWKLSLPAAVKEKRTCGWQKKNENRTIPTKCQPRIFFLPCWWGGGNRTLLKPL